MKTGTYKCLACGTYRPTGLIGWSLATMNTYCANHEICNEDHPHYHNDKVVSTRDDLMREVQFKNNLGENTLLYLKKLMVEPATLRPDPEQIAYIMKYQDKYQTLSMNETLKEIINENIRMNEELSKRPLKGLRTNWEMQANTKKRIKKLIDDDKERISTPLSTEEIERKKFEEYKVRTYRQRIAEENAKAEREAARKRLEAEQFITQAKQEEQEREFKLEEKEKEANQNWSV